MHQIQSQRRRPEVPAVPRSYRRQVRIANQHGLHLRAASHFVQLARQFQANVRVRSNGREADGKSVLDLTLLAADRGALLELELSGIDAQEAASALCELIEQGFHEDEDGGDTSPIDD
jgi:phosphocarrier protein HPr